MNPMPIWFEDGKVKIIDQTKLPTSYEEKEIKTVPEMWNAIKGLLVRGAPAIGLAGAFGVYISVKNWAEDPEANSMDFLELIRQCVNYLDSARPTAVNLHWALMRMQYTANMLYEKVLTDGLTISDLVLGMLYEAEKMLDEDVASCRAIGEFGADLLESIPGFQAFLTHCNAGALATSRFGTALSPAYILKERGKRISVYSDETRPLLQGSRLTAWELVQAGIPVTTICDNMAGVVMQKGLVQAVITGADRIAANGDSANKIGTYSLSILAKAHNIPFYIAAPLSTIDMDTPTGNEIPIEEREAWEVRQFGEKQTAPDEAKIFNPAFDVTPQENITGIITEKGIIYPPYHENIALVKQGKQPVDDYRVINEMKHSVAAYGKRLKEAGLVCASFGNVSMLDESRRFLAITPSGVFYDDIQDSDICVIDLEKDCLVSDNGRKPSSELPMHQAVYEARQDVFSVIHTHSIYATVAASFKNDNTMPMTITELCMVAPDGIQTAEFALPGSAVLAKNAVEALGKNFVCLLANHGTLCCGPTLERTFTTAAVLEEGAKVYVIGKQTGRLSVISRKTRKRIFEDMENYGLIK